MGQSSCSIELPPFDSTASNRNQSHSMQTFPSSSLIQADRKLAGLHGLRAVAAALVVVFHLKHIGALALPDGIAQFVGHCYLSVQLFFVLSAYSLFYSNSLSPTTVRAYFAKRFFRIAPLFYIMVGFQVLRSGMPGIDSLLANLSFTFNLIPGHEAGIPWAGWSVGVEMVFYAMLPVLLWFVSKRENAIGFLAGVFGVCVALEVGAWYAASLPHMGLNDDYAYYSIFGNLAPFSAGLLACGLFLKSQASNWRPSSQIGFPIAFFALISIAFMDPLFLQWHVPGLYFAIWSLPFSVLCIWQSYFPARILEFAPTQWLADRSFSIYLLHPIVIVYAKPLFVLIQTEWGLEGVGLFAVCLALTAMPLLLLADAAFRFVELPGIRLGRRVFAANISVQPENTTDSLTRKTRIRSQ